MIVKIGRDLFGDRAIVFVKPGVFLGQFRSLVNVAKGIDVTGIEHVMSHGLNVLKRQGACLPVDTRIVLFEPLMSEDNVMFT